MPIYEFRCSACRGDFEVLLRADVIERTGGEVVCPGCASGDVTRLMSSAAAHAGATLPVTSRDCPPFEAGPCGPGCCRLPE